MKRVLTQKWGKRRCDYYGGFALEGKKKKEKKKKEEDLKSLLVGKKEKAEREVDEEGEKEVFGIRLLREKKGEGEA